MAASDSGAGHGDPATPPSAWVDRFLDRIPAGGEVLDIAAGGGRHSRLAARRGYRVLAVDRDAAALEALSGLSGVVTHRADLEDGTPWPFAAGRFAGVIVCNYLHRPRLPDLVAAVAPGGVLIYETFAVGNERFGRPRNPHFLLRPGELLDAAAPHLSIVAYECGVEARPSPRVVQRLCAVAPPTAATDVAL